MLSIHLGASHLGHRPGSARHARSGYGRFLTHCAHTELIGKDGNGEGFRAPAFATVGRAPGPALESLLRK
jgi:hypothetical protein